MPRKATATAVTITPAPKGRITHRKTTTEATVPPPPASTTEDDIARLAYALWEERGCPEGTGEEDWFRAQELLVTTAK